MFKFKTIPKHHFLDGSPFWYVSQREYGYVDEELTPSEEELQKEFCWVIDPLDSTRDFVEGRDGFSIIIGFLSI